MVCMFPCEITKIIACKYIIQTPHALLVLDDVATILSATELH